VARRERGHRPQKRRQPAREQHEPEHEQQVIEARGDVERTEPQIVAERVERGRAFGDHERGRARVQHRLHAATVAQRDAHDRVGAGLGEPAHAHARADQPRVATARRPAHGQALRVALDARALGGHARLRQLGRDVGAARLLARHLEAHRDRAVGLLVDREQRRRERVGGCGRREQCEPRRRRQRSPGGRAHQPRGMLCGPSPSAHA
jgi:hypothetical protein